jgi:hypothetical protein
MFLFDLVVEVADILAPIRDRRYPRCSGEPPTNYSISDREPCDRQDRTMSFDE